MTNPIFRLSSLFFLVSPTGKVALVSLFRPSNAEQFSADELAEEIRRTIEASALSDSWVVERITVLDEDGSAVKVLPVRKARKIAVA